MPLRFSLAGAAGAVLFWCTPFAWAGSVHLLSQERCVIADAAAGIEGRYDARQDSSNWVNGSRFDAAASASAHVEFPEAAPLEGTQQVTASQTSDVGGDRIEFRGKLSIRGVGLSDFGMASSSLSTVFELSAVHAVWFDLSLINRGELLGDRQSRYTIQRLGGDDGSPIDLPMIRDLPAASSMLSAGTYRLSFFQAADVAPGRSGEVEYKVNFRLIPVVEAEPVESQVGAEAGPTPIPLPPAVWTALTTMLGAGAVGAVRRHWRWRRGR
jgi:hypothetical protein